MATIVVDIKNGHFPSIQIPIETSVVWRNLDSVVHSVETTSNSSNYFNAGPILPGGESAPIEFLKSGNIDYVCRYHHGMTGTIKVMDSGSINIGSPSPGHRHHLKHYHGFVTGGSSADNLYMTHTPILADPRHHFQIILLGSLVEEKDKTAYNQLRNSQYGDGRVDIFHDHLSLPDIGNGTIKELPKATLTYKPTRNTEIVPGTTENSVRVKIEKIILFHQFDKNAPYPDSLEYYVYGDNKEVFIDHVIDRAPGFHTVAKLKGTPTFWANSKGGDLLKIKVPSKKIKSLPPQQIERAAMVDNSYQLFWLPPAGIYRPNPQDPLLPRDGSDAKYDVVLENGDSDVIEVDKFIHFDFKLLNYGVLILETMN
ncbi:MAG: cupredoxin domain-containing protein [Arenicella sp.]